MEDLKLEIWEQDFLFLLDNDAASTELEKLEQYLETVDQAVDRHLWLVENGTGYTVNDQTAAYMSLAMWTNAVIQKVQNAASQGGANVYGRVQNMLFARIQNWVSRIHTSIQQWAATLPANLNFDGFSIQAGGPTPSFGISIHFKP